MGRDIHYTIEQKKSDSWEAVFCTESEDLYGGEYDEEYEKNSIEFSKVLQKIKNRPKDLYELWGNPLYLKRDYFLFAFLSSDQSPISPIDWPEDATITSQLMKKTFGEDGHSHGCYMARDILKFPYESSAKWFLEVFPYSHTDILCNSYYEILTGFTKKFLPALRELGNAEKTRILFFYDC